MPSESRLVAVTDEEGVNPIAATMTWAWVPKKKDDSLHALTRTVASGEKTERH